MRSRRLLIVAWLLVCVVPAWAQTHVTIAYSAPPDADGMQDETSAEIAFTQDTFALTATPSGGACPAPPEPCATRANVTCSLSGIACSDPPCLVDPEANFTPSGGPFPNADSYTLKCTRGAVAQRGVLSCTESYFKPDAPAVNRIWDVTCPSAGVAAFGSTPAPGPLPLLSVAAGGTVTTSIVVSSTGTAPLRVEPTGLSAPLSIQPSGVSDIAVGSTRTYTVTCAPQVRGETMAQLTLVTNAGDHDFDVTCRGLAAEFDSTPAPVAPPGSAQLDPIDVPVGAIAGTSLVVRNEGDLLLQVATAEASAIVSVVPTAANIAPGGQQSFDVRCAPVAAGTLAATIDVTTNDADEAARAYGVTCNATTQQPPDIALDAAPIALFATQGGAAPTTAFVLRNVAPGGSASLAVSGFSFVVLQGPGQPFGVTPASADVVPGAPAQFTLSCQTGAVGAYRAQLRVASNDPDENPFVFDVECTISAATAPEVTVVPAAGTALVFTTETDTDADQIVSVRNVGSASLTISSVSGPSGIFSLVGPPSTPLSLAPGAMPIDVRVRCRSATPTSPSPATGTLTIATNDADEANLSFPLQCTVRARTGEFETEPPGVRSLAFDTPKGVVQSRALTVRNIGTATLVVTAAQVSAAPFAVMPPSALPVSIGPNATSAFTVQCQPDTVAVGSYPGSLTLTTNDTDPGKSPVVVSLSCQVRAAIPDISVSTAPIDIVADAGQLNGQALQITNVGAATSQLTYVIGGFSAPIVVVPSTSGTLPAGQSAFPTIGCSPQQLVNVTQLLQIDTNDPDEDPVTIPVTCRGNAPEFSSSTPAGTGFSLVTTTNATVSEYISVTNTGTRGLQVGTSGLSPPLSIAPSGSFNISPGSSLTFRIDCQGGSQPTAITRTLVFVTNDADEGAVPYEVNCRVSPGSAARARLVRLALGAGVDTMLFKDSFE